MSALTRDELLALPPVLDVQTAAQVLGIGLSTARDLVRREQWPSRVLRVGRQYRIPTAPLLEVLGITPDVRQPTAAKSTHGLALVSAPPPESA